MTRTREPYFVVSTPYPGAAKVVCYKETWDTKLTEAGRVTDTTRVVTEQTLTSPAAVVAGTSNPGYIAFVNQSAGSPGSGSPFVVFVDPQGNPMPAVASVGQRRDFKDLNKHTILWQPSPTSSSGSQK